MKNNNLFHTPVLLQEAVDALQVVNGKKYIDGTLGGGGHSELILERGGVVLGIDRDSESIDEANKRFKSSKSIKIVKGNFENIKQIAIANGYRKCEGIVFDLGVSVHQIKDLSRGFSFNSHYSIDMRMDKDQELTAREIINNWSRDELVYIFEKYGEENEANEIATQIVKERKTKEIIYADALAEIITSAKKRRDVGINPATKVFQAIRIAVNDELRILEVAIAAGIDLLNKKSRIVVISFHSLEDRIVKKTFLEMERAGMGKVITKKPIRASFYEVNINKKSRSAKLRVFEKG